MIQGVLLIILSLAVILIAIIVFSKYKKISTNGIEADAIIFDIESSPTNGDTTITFPIVRFVTEKNEWVTQKASVSIIPYSYKKGQSVVVVYSKDKPSDFFIKSNWTNGVLIAMIIIGLALITYGVCFLA
ncbi:MAG: hypothetical protein RL372_1613 [Bacteroidota bacterium]|jgi:hypothetical protein